MSQPTTFHAVGMEFDLRMAEGDVASLHKPGDGFGGFLFGDDDTEGFTYGVAGLPVAANFGDVGV